MPGAAFPLRRTFELHAFTTSAGVLVRVARHVSQCSCGEWVGTGFVWAEPQVITVACRHCHKVAITVHLRPAAEVA
jgi:hypothetical protein